ncbi:hypothetical protein LINPERPRIM_LOCUS26852 [Linum perenne]
MAHYSRFHYGVDDRRFLHCSSPFLNESAPSFNSPCPSCRRCSSDAVADELDQIAHDLSILSLIRRNLHGPPPQQKLPAVRSVEMLKNAAKATVLENMNRTSAYPRLPRGSALDFRGGGGAALLPRGHRKDAGGGHGALTGEIRVRKPQLYLGAKAAASLQKQQKTRRNIQSRVNPFQGNDSYVPRKEPVAGGNGTGVFHPQVENKPTKTHLNHRSAEYFKRKLPNYPGGNEQRQEHRRAAPPAAGEVMWKYPIGGSGGGGGDVDKEEEDCHNDLPPELCLPAEWPY